LVYIVGKRKDSHRQVICIKDHAQKLPPPGATAQKKKEIGADVIVGLAKRAESGAQNPQVKKPTAKMQH